jgi:hypothetical protein
MGWDFSTDRDYAEKLDWARAFARREIWPLETIAGELSQEALDRGYAPPPGAVPTEHVPTRREDARRRFAELLDAVTADG